MNTKEKAPTSAATLAEAGVEIAACGRAAISYDHITTAAAGRQIKIADYLGHSQESAVTGRELCALTGLDHRTIRAQIEQERRAGALIVADNKSGYWVTDDPAEAYEAARKLQSIPRNANPIRLHNRCKITGRPKGYMRQFGLSRIQFREMASAGLIPGVKKASW